MPPHKYSLLPEKVVFCCVFSDWQGTKREGDLFLGSKLLIHGLFLR